MTNDEGVAEVHRRTAGAVRHSAFGICHWRDYALAFLDLLYTRRCEACDVFLAGGRAGARRWLCDTCHDGMARIEAPFCQVCGEPYEGAVTALFRCGNCSDLRLNFEFAIAGYKAEGGVRELLHRFKYQRALHLRGLLGTMLECTLEDARFGEMDRDWFLVPVPLHHARQREREYNQSLELCRVLARSRGLRLMDAMRRVKPTTAQASLSRRQRIENLRGAFALKRKVVRGGTLNGKNVLLVDDVLTTGSTTSECARVLMKEGGASRVVVITVARG